MSLLWTTEQLVAAMGGRPIGRMPEGITGISIDTRTLAPGDAFFAIKGERTDGHNFTTAAMAAGAGLMVVAEGRLSALGRVTTPMIVVDDVLKALEELGVAARARSHAKIVAVTGSAGKTTTKEALRLVLSAFGKVHAAERSFNNHWGVPLTLARMPQDTDYAIYEIGMNHPGEIRPLVKLVRPHVAVVTLIAAAHLGHFASLDDIARAKAEIFEGIVPGGHALVNRDDHRWRILDRLAKEAGVKHVVGFGAHSRAQVKLVECSLATDHSTIRVRVGGGEVEARVGAPGRHMVQNALAVLGAAHLVGVDVGRAAAALADLRAERGRGARHLLRAADGDILLIDESYNANPASMKAALDVLGGSEVAAGGRRIAVLGDMLELGSHSAKLHAALTEPLAEAKVDQVFLAGTEMAALRDALGDTVPVEHRDTAEDVAPLLRPMLKGGDVVMLKSSNGMGFSRIVEALIKAYPPSSPAASEPEKTSTGETA